MAQNSRFGDPAAADNSTVGRRTRQRIASECPSRNGEYPHCVDSSSFRTHLDMCASTCFTRLDECFFVSMIRGREKATWQYGTHIKARVCYCMARSEERVVLRGYSRAADTCGRGHQCQCQFHERAGTLGFCRCPAAAGRGSARGSRCRRQARTQQEDRPKAGARCDWHCRRCGACILFLQVFACRGVRQGDMCGFLNGLCKENSISFNWRAWQSAIFHARAVIKFRWKA